MPTYLLWGEDDYAIESFLRSLKASLLHPNYASLNFNCYAPDRADLLTVLSDAQSPPWGEAGKLILLPNTSLLGHCPKELLACLERTLEQLSTTTTLVLTSRKKPDGRLKSTQILMKYAQVQEFSPIASWDRAGLIRSCSALAQALKISIRASAIAALSEAVGNDTYRLASELQKLALYAGDRPLEVADIQLLVIGTTQTSLDLAAAIRRQDISSALALVHRLVSNTEPTLRITATLTAQFRTWLWVKTLVASGESDAVIASESGIGNPKRLYYLRQEVAEISQQRLKFIMATLLELEVALKRGVSGKEALSHFITQMC